MPTAQTSHYTLICHKDFRYLWKTWPSATSTRKQKYEIGEEKKNQIIFERIDLDFAFLWRYLWMSMTISLAWLFVNMASDKLNHSFFYRGELNKCKLIRPESRPTLSTRACSGEVVFPASDSEYLCARVGRHVIPHIIMRFDRPLFCSVQCRRRSLMIKCLFRHYPDRSLCHPENFESCKGKSDGRINEFGRSMLSWRLIGTIRMIHR
jgi:hypothetical protein